MKSISYTPKNKEHFYKLLDFAKLLLNKCDAAGIKPVVYGSLACAFYTEDNNIDINDIDFLTDERYFPEIISSISDDGDIVFEETEYNSLRLFCNGAKMSLHSVSNDAYKDLNLGLVAGEVNGVHFNFVTRDILEEIYNRGVSFATGDKLDSYKIKIKILEQSQSSSA